MDIGIQSSQGVRARSWFKNGELQNVCCNIRISENMRRLLENEVFLSGQGGNSGELSD
jgi:hypothetical protein